MTRGSVYKRIYELGLEGDQHDVGDIFPDILDMFLTGQTGRPSSKQMLGRLEYLLDNLWLVCVQHWLSGGAEIGH